MKKFLRQALVVMGVMSMVLGLSACARKPNKLMRPSEIKAEAQLIKLEHVLPEVN